MTLNDDPTEPTPVGEQATLVEDLDFGCRCDEAVRNRRLKARQHPHFDPPMVNVEPDGTASCAYCWDALDVPDVDRSASS